MDIAFILFIYLFIYYFLDIQAAWCFPGMKCANPASFYWPFGGKGVLGGNMLGRFSL